MRPKELNLLVGIDLEMVPDPAGKLFTSLNVLDLGTKLSEFRLVSDKTAKTVAKSFQEPCVAWTGPPETVMHDMGGELDGVFTAKIMQIGCASRVAGTESHRQNAMVERHGDVLRDIVEAIVEELQLVRKEDMVQEAMWAATEKNRRVDRTGYSSRSRVFGKDERFPGSVVDARLDGARLPELKAAYSDPVLVESFQIRTASMTALEALDSSDRWKRAIVAGEIPKTAAEEWVQWAQVFSFGKKKGKTRSRLK